MATEKDIDLINFLLAETEKGNIRWEATARLEQFTTSLKGKYNVTIDRRIAGTFGTPTASPNDSPYSLRLTDAEDREFLALTEDDYARIKDLFDLARRRSLNVDAAIDEILGSSSSGKDLRF